MSNAYRSIKLFAFVSGLCMASCTAALAQQSLFVYLQSENLQPFYVQLDDKVYSSSAIGHLIISGLPEDKTCNFEIGFPQRATQPQRFSIPLRNKDRGYQLVSKGSGNWALLDLQTDETIKPLKEAGSSSLLYGERKNDDAFATLMAAVVNDSAVLYTSIVKKEVETVPTVASTEAQPADSQQQVKAAEKPVQPKDSAMGDIKIKEEAVTVTNISATIDPASQAKSDSGVVKTTDTLVTKYDPKERGLNDKPVVGGVAKVQQQTKNGETKMVFVDSSETPAKVVTVYINEEKQPENTPAAQAPLATVTTPTSSEVVKDPEKSEPAKAQTKEEVAEKIKKETYPSAAPEKKPATTDTVTIVLESAQMKKSTAAPEESKPLYRPKEEKPAEPVKPAASNNVMAQLNNPGKMEVELVTGNAVVKEVPVKPEAADSVYKKEAAKETPKAVMDAKPAGPVAAQKDTATVVAKAAMEKPKTVEPEKKEENPGKVVMINSDCVKLATESDVDKMRVKMMAESDLQKRLGVANKYFRTMCLYAKQIKGLSELFPDDESKYKFLELAYPFAADTANFKQLYELLTDEAYVTKFKKLVRLQ
jgi:hypothetical protein